MSKVIPGFPIVLSPPMSIVGKGQIRQEIVDLYGDLLLIHEHGKSSPVVFSNRMPKPEKLWSKTLQESTRKIQAIYAGQFIRDYRICPAFYNKNPEIGKGFEKIKELKGLWNDITCTIFESARNYSKWFWLENEPESKEWLTRDISTWLYDKYNQMSLFLICLSGPPFPLRETQADRIYYSLPVKIRAVAEDFCREDWDPVIYWKKIAGIVDWYLARVHLQSPGLLYWFQGGLAAWLRQYLEWLLAFDGLLLKQLGAGNATWDAWCSKGGRDHAFSCKVLNPF